MLRIASVQNEVKLPVTGHSSCGTMSTCRGNQPNQNWRNQWLGLEGYLG